MKSPLLRTALLTACLTLRLAAATPDSTPEQTPIAEPPPVPAPLPAPAQDDQKKLEEAIRLRLAEHALKKASKADHPATATPPETPANPAAPAAAAATPAKDANAQVAQAKEDPATTLPSVQVSKSRITDLAIQLQQKDREIAQEKKNSTPTALDDTLNDDKVSHSLSVFGGSSADDRARLAQERVSLLEAERDLIEQIAQARTKDERDDLQNQLNELKTMRRELERTPKGTRGD
jgi:hypothetical protein